jgi:hypothetical protein
MVPLDRFRPLFKRQYRAGQEYVLVDHRERSDESHRHFFACVRKGWENLPEDIAWKYPTQEHLRKACLVKEGYADQADHVCISHDAAVALAALIRKIDPYAVMQIHDDILTIWTAQSQDHASMGHEVFQQSKTKILERIADMCGITLADLTKNAKENA